MRFNQLMMQDGMGRVPLHYAAQRGDESIIMVLIQDDWRIMRMHFGITDNSRLTPYDVAVAAGHTKIAEILLMRLNSDLPNRNPATVRSPYNN